MIEGVSKGFSKKLQMVGIGYKANYTNSTLTLNVGYSHPIKFLIPAEINLKIDNFTNITIDGIDKQLVGDLASKIRNIRSPEPYKGKGIRYTNEVIRYKAGKSGKK
jgi:large subunit ribosomal protein L6